MERFGFSGLWRHTRTTLIAAALPVAAAVVSYLEIVQLPPWAKVLVGLASAGLAFYKGKVPTPGLV